VPLVVDSSVAVSWMIADEDSEQVRRALALAFAEGIIGPRVLWYEFRNSLIVNERRGRLLTSETERALSVFTDLEPIFIDDHDESELLRLSRQHTLTVYDAAYLELAKRLIQPLATFDHPLAAAAIAEGVEVIG
jgi:predicted nucleic acid-binding protein